MTLKKKRKRLNTTTDEIDFLKFKDGFDFFMAIIDEKPSMDGNELMIELDKIGKVFFCDKSQISAFKIKCLSMMVIISEKTCIEKISDFFKRYELEPEEVAFDYVFNQMAKFPIKNGSFLFDKFIRFMEVNLKLILENKEHIPCTTA